MAMLYVLCLIPRCICELYILFVVQPPAGWEGGVGFVSKDMIKTHCPAPAGDIKVTVQCQRLAFLEKRSCY